MGTLILCSPKSSEVPWWLSSKDSACQAGDTGSIPGSGRSPGEGNGNPLQYSCLGNLMDRKAWWVQFTGSQRMRHDWATKQQQILQLLQLLLNQL